MKNLLLTIALLVFFSASTFANTIFVTVDGNGNGSSWQNPTSLKSALKMANSGDQIWVAKGTYTPGDSRSASFKIKNNIQVFGGFAGTETSTTQRDFINNETIISGEIGTSFADDNIFNLVTFKDVSSNTVLDGFTLTAGAATETVLDQGNNKRSGGAIFNSNGSPMIANCIFKNNMAHDGGAIYNFSNKGESSPSIVNCQFVDNSATSDGGAIFNDGRFGGVSNPNIENCIFRNNQGNYGGAIFNHGAEGESSPYLTQCAFNDNEAYNKGANMYNMDVDGVASPGIHQCQFDNNDGVMGAGIYSYGEEAINGRGVLAAN